MAAIPVDGINDEALTDAATDARSLLTDESGNNPDFDGDGRVFELLSLIATNTHASADAILIVSDANEGAAPSAALQKLPVTVPFGATVQLTWPKGAGPRFGTGIVGSIEAGTIGAGGVHASGMLH